MHPPLLILILVIGVSPMIMMWCLFDKTSITNNEIHAIPKPPVQAIDYGSIPSFVIGVPSTSTLSFLTLIVLIVVVQ